MKNKIIVLIFILAILLAVIFMVKGASDTGRKYSVDTVDEYNYFVLQKDNAYGVIDKNAKIIIEPKFESVIVPNPSKGLFICYSEDDTVKVYNEKNEEIFSKYEEISSIRLKNIASGLMYEKSVLKYRSGDKYGLIDYSGNKLTEAIYGNIESLGYKEGELLVEQNGKYGVINIKGTNLVPVKYETIKVDAYYTEEDKYDKSGYIIGIKTDEGYRYGYMDVDGELVLDLEYNDISRITDVNDSTNIYLNASKNGQFGVYKNKSKIINTEYQSIQYSKNANVFILEKSKKYGIADIDGNIILEVKYPQIDINGKYLYAKDKDGKIEVFDNKGNKTNISEDTIKIDVADGKYTIVIQDENDRTKYGIEDKNGKKLIETKYSYLEYLYDNYFIACNEEGKLGVISDKDEAKVEIKFSSIQKIKDTKLIQATIQEEGLTQIYSEKMEKISEVKNARFESINDYIEVKNDEAKIYLTKEGKTVDKKEVYKDNDLISVQKDGKWGFEDKKGTLKVECIYDEVTEFNEYKYAGIKKDNKWGVIDSTGKVILEPKYEITSNEEPSFLGEFYKITYGFGEVYFTNK